MLCSGIGATALLTVAPGAATAADDRDLGWKKINELTTSAIVDPSKATISTNLGERGALIERTAPGVCFNLLPLTFSGTSDCRPSSLKGLTGCRRTRGLLSNSPRHAKST